MINQVFNIFFASLNSTIKCENKLSEIEKNSVTLISRSKIQKICSKSRWPGCTIEFYQSNNCSGEPIVSIKWFCCRITPHKTQQIREIIMNFFIIFMLYSLIGVII